jgi:hypothetical protein
MSNSQIHLESSSRLPPLGLASEESNWYAVHTKVRHEKRVAAQFEEKRVCTFLSLLCQIHRWSERRSKVEVPMFGCYVYRRRALIESVFSSVNRKRSARSPGRTLHTQGRQAQLLGLSFNLYRL